MVRYMFDSMWTYMTYEKKAVLWVKFPDFVMSFLDSYYFDDKSKECKKYLRPPHNLEDIKAQFLIDLQNPRMDKIIDVILFKDFFYEKLDSEDLYFYLYMRNILYRGL